MAGDMARDVVVLGAGVAGLATARGLRERLPDTDRIVLVDSSTEQVQGLSLLWLLRGWRDREAVTLRDGYRALPGVEFVHGRVERIDPGNRTVLTDIGTLSYDALVCALGAELDIGRLPGLAEAEAAGDAVHYYAPDAALAAQARIRALRRGKVVVLVCDVPYKCPGAPYEGAMLVADLLTETGARSSVEVEVCTPEPQPMPVAGPEVGRGVVSMMERAGIRFRPSTRITSVDADGRVLRGADGLEIPFDLLVFVPPHRPPRAIAELGLAPAGWAPVDPRSLQTSLPDVWALGDNSMVVLENGKPLPKAAVFAKAQAVTVAAGVARFLGYDVPDVPFDGLGHCYLEAGALKAARGAGNFYVAPDPDVRLEGVSAELHREKEREESEWLQAWRTAPVP
ncbi:FAD/NAD(P)-binding oxidoreductase [Blastococcus montanus]|uniref:NAD(P)/FAD-dependent oxidoreductase n=1 Tax=Blastococcus montanus TaxID=3144973 RepID=UPI00320A12B9